MHSMAPGLTLVALLPESFDGAEALLEDLSAAEAAFERLCELTGAAAESLGTPHGWRACVDVGGTLLLLHGKGETWSISAGAGMDLGDAMSAARRLHGLLGAEVDSWDLDR